MSDVRKSVNDSRTPRVSRTMQQMLSLLYIVFLTNWFNAATAARSVRRLCKNEIDMLSDEGVHIEPLEQSRVELLLAEKKIRHRNAIKLEFRTTKDNGILFYSRNHRAQEELLALNLLSGDLYYKIHCSTVSADVLIPHKAKLNDGRWHSVVVRFRRGGMKTQIEVDGVKDSKCYEVSCGDMTSMVFGGISPHDRKMVDSRLGHLSHFEGCIRRVNISAFYLRSPPKYHAISICEN